MKILIIVGDCIQVNSSANLCHLAYIRGLIEAGHEVSLISSDGKGYSKDPSLLIPKNVRCFRFYGQSIYEKLSRIKKQKQASSDQTALTYGKRNDSITKRLIGLCKRGFLSLYGTHGIYAKFVWKAKKFQSKDIFDYVLSLSTPPASHLLAYQLIHSGHVKCNKWIQIWEDPWYSDAYGFNNSDKVFKEEKRLLSLAESVCYVSPITLENQKKLFPESAHKMFWKPLPSYYKPTESASNTVDSDLFGYFGAYYPSARNLGPFYEAARNAEIRVNICGDPSRLFSPTENIHIYPRMTLDELRPFEEKTGVLVFVCNRTGGQIPGKIYQYAATSKTILFILDGSEEEKKVLREYFEPLQRFVFCDNTVEDILYAIERIRRNELGNVKNVPLTQFSPEKIAQSILMEG